MVAEISKTFKEPCIVQCSSKQALEKFTNVHSDSDHYDREERFPTMDVPWILSQGKGDVHPKRTGQHRKLFAIQPSMCFG